MAENTEKRGHLTLAEKLDRFRGKARLGLDELALLLVDRLSDRNLTQKGNREILDTFLDLIEEGLKGGRTVVLPGFGSFRVKERKARRVRNPRVISGPGSFKEVGPSTVFRFKPGSGLKPIFHD